LPEPIRSLVTAGAEAMSCDPANIALPALAVSAALIGNSRVLLLKHGWTEPSVVWAAVVAESGTTKSPAQKLATAEVYRLQREMLELYDQERRQFEATKAEMEAKLRQAKKEGKPPDEALPDPPKPGRLVTTDTTLEKLGQLLADNPRGMLVCRDELRAWLGSFTRYKGSSDSSDLPAWLEFFRAETAVIDRKTGDRPTLFIPRAAVSVCGTVQPGTLGRSLTMERLEAGLAARLLLAMPPAKVKVWV
jgi:hypothetical protein